MTAHTRSSQRHPRKQYRARRFNLKNQPRTRAPSVDHNDNGVDLKKLRRSLQRAQNDPEPKCLFAFRYNDGFDSPKDPSSTAATGHSDDGNLASPGAKDPVPASDIAIEGEDTPMNDGSVAGSASEMDEERGLWEDYEQMNGYSEERTEHEDEAEEPMTDDSDDVDDEEGEEDDDYGKGYPKMTDAQYMQSIQASMAQRPDWVPL